MAGVIRFNNMTVVIPIHDGETASDVEDRLIDAIEAAGSMFTSYAIEVEGEED